MSESDNNADDSATEETGGASQDAPDQSVQHQETGGGTSVDDFVGANEQAIIKEWVLYVTGLFVAFGVGIGLNSIIQDQWSHALTTTSVMGQSTGTPFTPFNRLGLVMNIGILAIVLLGILIAWNVDNEEYTAIKVAVATSVVGIPVLTLVTGFLVLIPADNTSLEFVNVIVSSLGSAIAATVGATIVIFLTESQTPAGLSD